VREWFLAELRTGDGNVTLRNAVPSAGFSTAGGEDGTGRDVAWRLDVVSLQSNALNGDEIEVKARRGRDEVHAGKMR